MTLDLWGISFHAVVVFCPGKNLLFKSILGRCDVHSVMHAQCSMVCSQIFLIIQCQAARPKKKQHADSENPLSKSKKFKPIKSQSCP